MQKQCGEKKRKWVQKQHKRSIAIGIAPHLLCFLLTLVPLILLLFYLKVIHLYFHSSQSPPRRDDIFTLVKRKIHNGYERCEHHDRMPRAHIYPPSTAAMLQPLFVFMWNSAVLSSTNVSALVFIAHHMIKVNPLSLTRCTAKYCPVGADTSVTRGWVGGTALYSHFGDVVSRDTRSFHLSRWSVRSVNPPRIPGSSDVLSFSFLLRLFVPYCSFTYLYVNAGIKKSVALVRGVSPLVTDRSSADAGPTNVTACRRKIVPRSSPQCEWPFFLFFFIKRLGVGKPLNDTWCPFIDERICDKTSRLS